MDADIHSKLISFVAILVAKDCLLLHDVISYIIKPIIRVQLLQPQGECLWEFDRNALL